MSDKPAETPAFDQQFKIFTEQRLVFVQGILPKGDGIRDFTMAELISAGVVSDEVRRAERTRREILEAMSTSDLDRRKFMTNRIKLLLEGEREKDHMVALHVAAILQPEYRNEEWQASDHAEYLLRKMSSVDIWERLLPGVLKEAIEQGFLPPDINKAAALAELKRVLLAVHR